MGRGDGVLLGLGGIFKSWFQSPGCDFGLGLGLRGLTLTGFFLSGIKDEFGVVDRDVATVRIEVGRLERSGEWLLLV